MQLSQPAGTNSTRSDILSLRQASLARYSLNDPATRSQCQTWVAVVAQTFQTPVAWLSFGDRLQHQVSASVGFDLATLEAGAGTLVRAIETHELLAVEDTHNFEVCHRAPLVLQAPFGRSFAGVALHNSQGIVLGTLAVLDVVPRAFDERQLDVLRAVGKQAIAHLELHSALAHIHPPISPTAQRSTPYADLYAERETRLDSETRLDPNPDTQETRNRAIASSAEAPNIPLLDVEWEANPDTLQFTVVKARSGRLLGYETREWLAAPEFWERLLLPADRAVLVRQRRDDIAAGRARYIDYRVRAADGRVVWLRERSKVVTDDRPTNDRPTNDRGSVPYLHGTFVHVTQCHQAELERDRLFHLSPDIVMEMGFDCQIRRINPAWQQLTGFSAQELSDRHVLSFVHPDDVDATRERLTQLRAGNRVTDFEHRLFRRDGTVIWLSWNAITYPDEQISYAIARDITARKQAEWALQRQSQRDRLTGAIYRYAQQTLELHSILAESSRDICAALQVDRVAIAYLAAEGTGAIVAEHVSQPDIKLPTEVLNKSAWFETVDRCRTGEMWCIEDTASPDSPDLASVAAYWSSLHTQAAICAPIAQEDGKLWGILLIHQQHAPRRWSPDDRDFVSHVVTQLAIAVRMAHRYQHVQLLNAELECETDKQTAKLQLTLEFESTLKRITDKVRDSLDESQILQTAVEEVARCLDARCCNAALYDLNNRLSTIFCEFSLDYPAMGRQTYYMENSSDIYRQLLDGQHFQYCARIPNPKRGRVAMLACPIRDNRGVIGDLWAIGHPTRGFTNQEVGLVQQVANQCAIAIRQARLYGEAQAQVLALEELNRLKDDFLSTISHELRTPMSNMKMAVSLLEVKLKRLLTANELTSLDRYLTILTSECERETQLIDDLLAFSQADDAAIAIHAQPLHLGIWLEEAIAPFRLQMKGRNQVLKLDIEPDFPIIATDPMILSRIIAELVRNAHKYTPAAGTISVTAKRLACCCILYFCNTGTSIAPEELDRIFDRFYRIPNADPWSQGGTGLGLALAKKLIHHLGGNITVSSQENAVIFRVELPWSADTGSSSSANANSS